MVTRAIGDRVFIRLEAKENKTTGGLYLPEISETDRTIGIVESAGEKVTVVKAGDRVLFHIFDELPSNDPDVVVVRENSLLGIIEDE